MNQDPIERRFRRLAVGANRKARRVGAKGRITDRDLFNVFMASEGVCDYCGIDIEPLSNSFDHVVAFRKGGENTVANLVACCITCQRAKFTKSPDEYKIWQTLEQVCPTDGTVFRPRWSDYVRGNGKYCCRRCSGSAGGKEKARNAKPVWR